MGFSVDYYKDEVRNGFYIPTAIKQAWAANLCVLSEIDRICKKYGITYFADWGTILGAVRHGGYVPWDDDLDICMKRQDYNRFREVADKELPNEFAIHDFRNKEDHWLFLARVVNSNQICFDEEHLSKYHNFPYISVVDIFIKDYLYRDEEKEKERCKEIKKLIAVADGIVDGSFSADATERELSDIEKRYGVVINRKAPAREIGISIYEIAEKQMAKVKEEEADNIGQMFPFVLKGDKGLPKEYYDDAIRLPFENTTIPVPARYNEMLTNRYGNYLEIHKIWGGHNYPYFEGQRANLQAVADFTLPEFSFDPEILRPCDREKTKNDSLVGLSHEFVEQFQDLHGSIVGLFETGEYSEVIDILPDIQQFVVDYATLLENVKGETRKSTQQVVAAVQEYCDSLYSIYTFLNESEFPSDGIALVKKLTEAFEGIVANIEKHVINRKEILFLPIGEKEWKVFDGLFKYYTECDEYDVFVVPMPVFFKDIYGRVIASDEEIKNTVGCEKYPDYLVLDSWVDYNIQLHRPDIIYIQNAYDGENPCLTVPPQYYAANIRQYTDKLIYTSPFVTEEFGADDYNDIYNMKHYVTAPGVIYADEILVQSENIKMRYIDKLSEFAGEKTRNIWEDQIKSIDKYYIGLASYQEIDTICVREVDNRTKKKILFCIGLNEVSEHRSDVLVKIKERVKIFDSSTDKIDVGVMFFPMSEKLWSFVDKEISYNIKCILDDCVNKGWAYIGDSEKTDYEDIVNNYDAYYGSASILIPMFAQKGKPVMIANYNI